MTVGIAAEPVFSRDQIPPRPDQTTSHVGAVHDLTSPAPRHLIDEQQIKSILYLGMVGSLSPEGTLGCKIDTLA